MGMTKRLSWMGPSVTLCFRENIRGTCENCANLSNAWPRVMWARGRLPSGLSPRDEYLTGALAERGRPDQYFESAVRNALANGMGLEEIRNAAAETAYQIVLREETRDTARSSERLKVSKRAVQMHLKNGSGINVNRQ